MSDRILVVTDEGARRPDGLGHHARLDFRFEAGVGSARRLETGGDGKALHEVWAVPERWRPLGADFRQQVLNVPFADLLTRARPRMIRVEQLVGCTLDLPRIAALLTMPVTVVLPPVHALPAPESREGRWLRSSLASATALELPAEEPDPNPYGPYTDAPTHAYGHAPQHFAAEGVPVAGFDYALYEFGTRDHGLLWRMQEAYVRFFSGCKRVLDLGCGAGVFMGLLEAAEIPAAGVERNPAIANYARGLGFDVTEADALGFLERQSAAFDGIYCSHFVEHLPTEQVDHLLGALVRAVEPGGTVVLVFPDPESIRSQLLGFWRDPEHVRFYHPDLIELMARAHGLDCVWHSHRDGPPREVVSFPVRPAMDSLDLPSPTESWTAPPVGRSPPLGRWSRWLARLGLMPLAHLSRLERRQAETELQLERLNAAFSRTQEALSLFQADTRRLWQVNQTWAWEDNAVLVLRRPGIRDDGGR